MRYLSYEMKNISALGRTTFADYNIILMQTNIYKYKIVGRSI